MENFCEILINLKLLKFMVMNISGLTVVDYWNHKMRFNAFLCDIPALTSL